MNFVSINDYFLQENCYRSMLRFVRGNLMNITTRWLDCVTVSVPSWGGGLFKGGGYLKNYL